MTDKTTIYLVNYALESELEAAYDDPKVYVEDLAEPQVAYAFMEWTDKERDLVLTDVTEYLHEASDIEDPDMRQPVKYMKETEFSSNGYATIEGGNDADTFKVVIRRMEVS